MDQATIDRNYLAWKDLMDFGWEFCLQSFAQLHPGEDPMVRLRAAWERKGIEHAEANLELARRLGESNVHSGP